MGRRTFLLLLSKRTTMALILMMVALILGTSKDLLAGGLLSLFKMAGSINPSVVQGFAAVVSGIALFLLIASVCMFIFGYIVSRLHYNNYTFTLEEFDIRLKKGLLDIKEISIPYRQIQNVDISKTVWYQMFGVSRLVLITAGHEEDARDETDTVFDPIDADIAEEVRQILQRRIGVQIVEGQEQADKENQESRPVV
jgi:uncharacterized membrane protein YdbT with pleckstrin-like domain